MVIPAREPRQFDSAIAALRAKAGDGMPVDELGLELHRILALGMDGHSGVVGYRLPGTRFLPFLIEAARRSLRRNCDESFGVPRGRSFRSSRRSTAGTSASGVARRPMIVPKGSPQLLRYRSVSVLRSLEFVRGLMGLPQRDSVDVALARDDGAARKMLTLPSRERIALLRGVAPR